MTTAILLPSLDRPQNLLRATANIHDNTDGTHCILFCVSDPESKRILDSLGEWYLDDSDVADHRYVTRMNKLIEVLPDDVDTMFFGSDDVIHHERWLSRALKVLARSPLVVVNDLRNQSGTQALIRREYLEHAVYDEPGLAFHPGYRHNFADTEQFFVANHRGQYARAMDSHVEHLHPLFGAPGSMPWDATYRQAQVGWDQDARRYEQRIEAFLKQEEGQ